MDIYSYYLQEKKKFKNSIYPCWNCNIKSTNIPCDLFDQYLMTCTSFTNTIKSKIKNIVPKWNNKITTRIYKTEKQSFEEQKGN